VTESPFTLANRRPESNRTPVRPGSTFRTGCWYAVDGDAADLFKCRQALASALNRPASEAAFTFNRSLPDGNRWAKRKVFACLRMVRRRAAIRGLRVQEYYYF
jgi:hypothetical protein